MLALGYDFVNCLGLDSSAAPGMEGALGAALRQICTILLHSAHSVAGSDRDCAQFCPDDLGIMARKCPVAWQKGTGSVASGWWRVGHAVGYETCPCRRGFSERCSILHHSAYFVAGGLCQYLAKCVSNGDFWGHFAAGWRPGGTRLEGAPMHGNRCDCRRWLRRWVVWAGGRSVLCWRKRSTDVRGGSRPRRAGMKPVSTPQSADTTLSR